jgi:hypothetical protein
MRMFPLTYNKNLVHTIIEMPLLKSDNGSHFRQYYNRFILCTKKNLHEEHDGVLGYCVDNTVEVYRRFRGVYCLHHHGDGDVR